MVNHPKKRKTLVANLGISKSSDCLLMMSFYGFLVSNVLCSK